jgi:hypothetical protein
VGREQAAELPVVEPGIVAVAGRVFVGPLVAKRKRPCFCAAPMVAIIGRKKA